MVALGEANNLVFFSSGAPEDVDSLAVTGLEGSLLGIDVRPADGRLDGLTSTGGLYAIDLATGVATLVSTLSQPFESRARSGFDFNPVPGALRITGANGQNFRVNPDTAEVTLDGTREFAAGDSNEGLPPSIAASAYTNNVDGAERTQLFNLDARLNALVLQDPPNDGGLRTRGELGFDLGHLGGFDIVTDEDGTDTAYVLADATLYLVDLESGAATPLGAVPDATYQGLAVTTPYVRL
jgi:hypothetical protein